MISRTQAESGLLSQLQACIPQLSGSIVSYLDKPKEMTSQVLATRHPKGLMLVQYDESEAGGKTEAIIVAVVCAAASPQQVVKLGDAAREALNEFQITGATRFELHDDKPVGNEEGIFVRSVRFRCHTPATPTKDRAATIAAMNL